MSRSKAFGVAELRGKGMIPLEASLHDYDAKAVSDATAIDTGSVSLVQQQFGDEVDINTIVRRFGLTREMPSGVAGGVYGDFTGIEDYDGAVAAIERAHQGFLTLAPSVREQFHNDPGELIRFAQAVPEDEFMARFREDEPVVVPDKGATAVDQ